METSWFRQHVLKTIDMVAMVATVLTLLWGAWDEFAPKTSVTRVFEAASEAHTKLDFAMMDRREA